MTKDDWVLDQIEKCQFGEICKESVLYKIVYHEYSWQWDTIQKLNKLMTEIDIEPSFTLGGELI